jgi:hypothetical protein
MQLWLQNVPHNEPQHLCFGMSIKNLNAFEVEIHAYHVRARSTDGPAESHA